MTIPVTPEQRAAIVRDICRREGHNWAEVTKMSDRWDRYMCVRGCGADRYGDPRGSATVANSLADLVASLEGQNARVDRLSIIVEGKMSRIEGEDGPELDVPKATGGIVTKPTVVGEGGPPGLVVPPPGPELPVDWSKVKITAKFGAGFADGIHRDKDGKATTLGAYGYPHPIAYGTCETCSLPVLFNLSVGYCGHDDEALNANCPHPFPAVKP